MSEKKMIRIGTRDSKLALVQAEMLKTYIDRQAGFEAMLVPMKTTGDKILDKPLDLVGGKGLFMKELDQALAEGRSDVSIHSLKDMTMFLPEDYPLLGVSVREDPRDVLVLPMGQKEWDLSGPIGCSSKRRMLQMKKLFPGARFESIRGNIQTRLKKLDEGEYGALILAAAGLKRLGLEHRIARYFSIEESLPAAGQGILGIQGRPDTDTGCMQGFFDEKAACAAAAERAFVRALDGGCSSPVAAYAEVYEEDGENGCKESRIRLRGLYYRDDMGDDFDIDEITGPASDAEQLGKTLAAKMDLAHRMKSKYPTVYLVGAGPYEEGLLTLKGKQVLEQAQVVLYDALAGPGILSFAPPAAERVYVGKRSGNHAIAQEEISAMMADFAKKGKRVVRLKGGDPFLFGRGGEELEVLAKEGIPFEVVPGVTSAISVPAYAGIPVTHRDLCSSVHIITGHRKNCRGQNGRADGEIDFRALIHAGGTCVFLMGVAALEELCQGLLKAGMDPDMPAALISRGTTSLQKKLLGTISTLPKLQRQEALPPPGILVVGAVCGLSDPLDWYGKKLLSRARVLFPRPRGRSRETAEAIRELGAEVWDVPLIETRACEDQEKLLQLIGEASELFGRWDGVPKPSGQTHPEPRKCWLVFTSAAGVDIFFDLLKERRIDLRCLAEYRFAVLGTGTGRALEERGFLADLMPGTYDCENLGKLLERTLESGTRVIIPRALGGNPELVRELKARSDIELFDLPLYDTLECPEAQPYVERFLRESEELRRYVLLTSASMAAAFEKIWNSLLKNIETGTEKSVRDSCAAGITLICIGEKTAQRAASLGLPIAIADQATMESVFHKLLEIHQDIS